MKKGNRRFGCGDCRLAWIIGSKTRVDYGQICPRCDSKHIIREGIRRNKQGFQCVNCKKFWSIPVADLVVKRSDNDLRYEKRKVQDTWRMYKKRNTVVRTI